MLVEISHFLKLIEPSYVFCDQEHYHDIITSLQTMPNLQSKVLISNAEEHLKKFAEGVSDNETNFV